MVAGVMGFGKKTREVKYHLPHIISRADIKGVNIMTAVMLTLVTGLIPCKVITPHFHIVIFGRQPQSLPTPQEWELGLPS